MVNPVVVFVIPERVQLCSEIFPIGFTDDGQRHNRDTLAGRDYCVLLLDDTADVPEDPPCRVSDAVPLLIIAHNRSQKHPDPAQERVWTNWSMPCVCKNFSHIPRDSVFEEIRLFLAYPTLANEFAKRCQAINHLKQMDGLAALCQCAILDPDLGDEAIDGLARLFEKQLDRQVANQFARCRQTSEHWAEALLGLVREEANRLAGNAP